eukprot:1122046-Pleurochrysis_carterae.AAC.6
MRRQGSAVPFSHHDYRLLVTRQATEGHQVLVGLGDCRHASTFTYSGPVCGHIGRGDTHASHESRLY